MQIRPECSRGKPVMEIGYNYVAQALRQQKWPDSAYSGDRITHLPPVALVRVACEVRA
jgi:hypothetical protein